MCIRESHIPYPASCCLLVNYRTLVLTLIHINYKLFVKLFKKYVGLEAGLDILLIFALIRLIYIIFRDICINNKIIKCNTFKFNDLYTHLDGLWWSRFIIKLELN